MSRPTDHLRPSIEPAISLDDIISHYDDAADAVRRGNYELALEIAARENDPQSIAQAMTLLGAVRPGAERLGQIVCRQRLWDNLR